MNEPHKITNCFLERFKDLGEYLKTVDVTLEHFETFAPISQAAIDKIQNNLDIKLDEALLAYFRESNGYQLRYTFEIKGAVAGKSDLGEGSIVIPKLEDIFKNQIFNDCYGPDEYQVDTLGGRDDFEIRSNMYIFDSFNVWKDSDLYYAIYYLATDNVLILAEDYDADIQSARPITIPSYFELCLATAGLTDRIKLLLETQVYPNNRDSMIDLAMDDYKRLYPWEKSIALAKKGYFSQGFLEIREQIAGKTGYYFNLHLKRLSDEEYLQSL